VAFFIVELSPLFYDFGGEARENLGGIITLNGSP